MNEWQPIETAPRDGTKITLRALIIPSELARKNAGTEFYHVADGSFMYMGDDGLPRWTGVLGGIAQEWKEKNNADQS